MLPPQRKLCIPIFHPPLNYHHKDQQFPEEPYHESNFDTEEDCGEPEEKQKAPNDENHSAKDIWKALRQQPHQDRVPQ